jgi:hypothetical protein
MHVRRSSGASFHVCDGCFSAWLGAPDRDTLAQGPSDRRNHGLAKFVANTKAATLPCPSCGDGWLQRGTIEGRNVLQCAACNGILLLFTRRERLGAIDAIWFP